MIKKILFLIKNIARIVVQFLISIITLRDKNMIIMGLRKPIAKTIEENSDYFMHNTKVLFLYLMHVNNHKFNIIYLCDNDDMISSFKNKGYKNIWKRKSIQGIYHSIRAKYWIYSDSKFDITNSMLSGGATCINLWHGISWKKFGFDSNINFAKRNKIQKQIQSFLYDKDDYVIANNEQEQECYCSAILSKKQNTLILGSPRYDMFFKDIQNIDLFMETDYTNIKNFKEQGKKLFLYMPTFRDTGKDVSGWLKEERLKDFLNEKDAIPTIVSIASNQLTT